MNIFDWLREQMQSNSNASEAEMYYMLDEDRGQCCLYSGIDLEEQKSKTWIDAISLVHEAEAKWEADCCEPIPLDKEKYSSFFNESFVFMGCSEGDEPRAFDRQAVLDMVYCPYCGKPIKISEVE